MTKTERFRVSTRGNSDVTDLTARVAEAIGRTGIGDGLVCVLVVGSTASITTTEAEPGLMTHDLKAFFDRIAPDDAYYKHEATWGDDNGHAHIRASLVGASITVPLVGRRMTLGQWQQIVLIDFDTRPREREIVVQVVGT